MIITESIKDKTFEPYTLNITFESVEELKVVWLHLNLPGNVVKEANRTSSLKQSIHVMDERNAGAITQMLWNTIDQKLRGLGEK